MLLSISRWALYVSVFCVLVVLASTFFPFIGGKYYFFRIAVEISLAALMLWWGFEAKPGELAARFARIARTWIFRAVSAFTLAFTLATLFADDPKIAFWSNYERGEGGFQMLHYYAFFVLLGLVFDKRKDWIKLFKLSVVAAVFMILYGLGAAIFLPGFVGPYRDATGGPSAPTLVGRIFSDSRFQGSLGNPAYVAPYLMFAIFYALYIWFSDRNPVSQKKRALYLGLIAFFLVFFVLSQTRGGFLGLAAAVPAGLLFILLADARLRKGASIGFGLIVALAALVYAFRGPLIAANAPGSRFLTISVSDQTAQTRFWTWNSAWQGFKEHPILGWGPENFSTVFDKYFDTRHYIPGQSTETWFDRAHSVIFDYLAETGLLGFLAYLSMFAAFYYEMFFRRRGVSAVPGSASGEAVLAADDSVVLKGLLLAMPIGYLVQGLILFDVLPIYINLFAVLAFAMNEVASRNDQ